MISTVLVALLLAPAAHAADSIIYSVQKTSGTERAATYTEQATQSSTLSSILAKLISAPSTSAKQDTIIGHLASLVAALTNPLPVSISGSMAVTGTFWPVTQPMSAVALPLPTGAATEAGNLATIAAKDFATSAKQDTGNTSLSGIKTGTDRIPALGQALAANSAPVVLTALQAAALTPPAALTNFANETGGNLATIAGKDFATSAKQDTGNTSLSGIKTGTDRIPAQGQALASGSTPVVLPAAQITTLTPPAAITNFANETGGNLATIKTNTDKIPSSPATDRATAAAPAACRLSDGSAFYAGATETTLSTLNGKVTACNTGAVAGTVAVSNEARSLGTTTGKLEVWKSSSVTTAAIGTIVASSYTITAGKTFYLQHIDIASFMNSQSTSTVNMVSVQISSYAQGGNAVVIASRTFVNGASQADPFWTLDFAEPPTFAALGTLFVKLVSNTATQIITASNVRGYEK